MEVISSAFVVAGFRCLRLAGDFEGVDGFCSDCDEC